jgi:hypothetical protein
MGEEVHLWNCAVPRGARQSPSHRFILLASLGLALATETTRYFAVTPSARSTCQITPSGGAMPDPSHHRTRHIDTASYVVVGITLVLFILAAFEKGLTGELSLEAGVFLVSVKLILMSAKSNLAAERMMERLDAIEAAVERLAAQGPESAG